MAEWALHTQQAAQGGVAAEAAAAAEGAVAGDAGHAAGLARVHPQPRAGVCAQTAAVRHRHLRNRAASLAISSSRQHCTVQ